MHIVKLIPNKNSKYHFGEGDLSESSVVFHSNSLFSAMVNNFIKLYGVDEFNKYGEEIKKLKISSLFPAIYKFKNKNGSEIEDEILFIPKPMVMLGFDKDTQEDIEEKPKDFKKIKFISIGALKKHNEKTLKKITIGKEYLITEDEKKKFGYNKPENMNLFKNIIEQKVSIDRIKGITLEDSEKGQLYAIEFIKPLRKDDKIVGFYFLADFNDIDGELVKKIRASIRLMKDEGLGGKRSIGAGIFKDIIIDEFNEDLSIDNKLLGKNYQQKNKTYISKEKNAVLSITIPKENEFENFNSYQLIKIGGYIYSSSNMEHITKLKKNVYALTEGSICEKSVEGQVLDLKPDTVEHEIVLNGRPILIPIVSYELDKGGIYEYI
ncbi:MAG: CRISPR-associated protein Csm4 [Methanothermococcus sp.]|uniref:type III-A CRISPR-associated RAMP protein Csm4 n=1 Tax=Methanothermococcus TaxID=155862 RepID=UPI000369ABC5|nr:MULTISPECIES: type III-A CRISPR-associated RAMP protein Csm4 [Methanothermococcus]MDK2790379.1 CRISPR-associated protein Csm4 [Methanothermococcus sp.]MDK2987510.1 CRISPR-associated protein Csm4 [Methanothermococcus sp.]